MIVVQIMYVVYFVIFTQSILRILSVLSKMTSGPIPVVWRPPTSAHRRQLLAYAHVRRWAGVVRDGLVALRGIRFRHVRVTEPPPPIPPSMYPDVRWFKLF